MRIYVASSWRNDYQPDVILGLREAGHEVYDFRNPRPENHGFHWSEIDREWKSWTMRRFIEALSHPLAEEGFGEDYRAMQWAEACVLVLPAGRSAHLEAGWFAGAGKPLLILLADAEPELMYKLASGLTCLFQGGVFVGLGPLLMRLEEVETVKSE